MTLIEMVEAEIEQTKAKIRGQYNVSSVKGFFWHLSLLYKRLGVLNIEQLKFDLKTRSSYDQESKS